VTILLIVATHALSGAIRQGAARKRHLKPGVPPVELDAPINDDGFAREVVARLLENIDRRSQT